MSDPKAIERLRAAGLVVKRQICEDKEQTSVLRHGDRVHAYWIAKPSHVEGNSRPLALPGEDTNSSLTWMVGSDSGERVPTDAPETCLFVVFPNETTWHFSHETLLWLGEKPLAPQPGEFNRVYPTLDQASDAVLEYYFGDPGWMNPPEVLERTATRRAWLQRFIEEHRREAQIYDHERLDQRMNWLDYFCYFAGGEGYVKWRYRRLFALGYECGSSHYSNAEGNFLTFTRLVPKNNSENVM